MRACTCERPAAAAAQRGPRPAYPGRPCRRGRCPERGAPGAQVRLQALRQELAAAQEVVAQLRRMVADAEAEARA